MRDDSGDDDFVEDGEGLDSPPPSGKIIHSGIYPESITPADYALPPGTPALQGGDPEHPLEEEFEISGGQKGHTRRTFLLMSLGGLGSAVGMGYYFGNSGEAARRRGRKLGWRILRNQSQLKMLLNEILPLLPWHANLRMAPSTTY